MTIIDWILLGSILALFIIGANVFDRALKLVSWIPLVKLVIRLVGGVVFATAGVLLTGSVIAPNVPMVATSQVGSWYVLIADLIWLSW